MENTNKKTAICRVGTGNEGKAWKAAMHEAITSGYKRS